MPLQGTLSHSGEGLTKLVRQCSTKLFLNSPLYFIPATLDWSNFDLLPYFRFKILSYNAPQPSTEIVTPLGEIISRRGEMASRHWEIVNHPGNIFLFLHVPNTLQFVTSTVDSEKQTKCFPSSESTCTLSSEMSISFQPMQKRSTWMIQVSRDLSMTINDFHEKLIILLKSIWHYSFIKRQGHS